MYYTGLSIIVVVAVSVLLVIALDIISIYYMTKRIWSFKYYPPAPEGGDVDFEKEANKYLEEVYEFPKKVNSFIDKINK